MLGYRGAARYVGDEEVFELELHAIKAVRQKMGYKNLHVMIPFVRTPDQLLKAKRIMGSIGLMRSPSFKLWMMVEIPVNVISIDDFLAVGIDGVSIGSNDLTQLILGVDRDNEKISQYFSELNPAVQWALERTVKACHKAKVTCSLCGQAASDYPDLVEKLVHWGITSVSVNADAVDKTRLAIAEAENKKVKK
jgi:pyruvate,water dikinase